MRAITELAIVNRFLLRLLLVAMMLCDFLGSSDGVMAKCLTEKGSQENESQVKQSDGYVKDVAEEPRCPVDVVFRSASSSSRLASSRPPRLLPTHGGKSGKSQGRWAADRLSNPYKHLLLQKCWSHILLRTSVASPRLYYVIALRRLLC